MSYGRVLLAGLVLAFAAAGHAWSQPAEKPTASASLQPPKVSNIAVIPVTGDISYGLQKSVERRIREALDAGAELLLFEMDTYGGDLYAGADTADLVNNLRTDTGGRVFTVAYVDKKAISAGSLISLACRQIVMRDSTTLGDCQAIQINPAEQTMKPAPEKIQTFVRVLMRKYAQSNGYPESLCEAMVDPEMEVFRVTFADGSMEYLTDRQYQELSEARRAGTEKELIVARGQLLTMSAQEAQEYGFSRATVTGLDEAVALYAAPGATQIRLETNWSEEMVRFLNSPMVAGILLMGGILALYLAFKTPGFGVPEAVALGCFTVLFLSKYLVGLASAVEVVIFIVGVALLMVEIFLIPGFGVTGIAGILCIFVSLVLSFQRFTIPETNFQLEVLVKNLVVIFGSFMAATVLFMFLVRHLPGTPFLRRAVLSTSETQESGYVVGSAAQQALVGRHGAAVSTLRPSGRAEIGGETLLVVTDGEFIEPGARIVVAEVSGNRIVVRRA